MKVFVTTYFSTEPSHLEDRKKLQ